MVNRYSGRHSKENNLYPRHFLLIIGWPFLILACILFEPINPEAFGPAGGAKRFEGLSTQTEIVQTKYPNTPTSEPTKPPQNTPTQPTPTIKSTSTALATSTPSIKSCSMIAGYIDQKISCEIRFTYCSYRPDINGSPTFCNDAPFPNYNFTLVVWGSDWSDYDGKCIVVTGLVTLYGGKPQIEASSRSQVSTCP